jgi:hypothetical protein
MYAINVGSDTNLFNLYARDHETTIYTCGQCQQGFQSKTLFRSHVLLHVEVCICLTNQTGAISGTGTAYPSGVPDFTPNFWWGLCSSIFSFLCCAWWITAWLFYFGHTVVCLFRLLLSLIDPLGTLDFLFLIQIKNNFISWWKSKFKKYFIAIIICIY